MKKMFFLVVLVIFLTIGWESSVADELYPEEAQKAGFSYEQYESILKIPKLPDVAVEAAEVGPQSRATSPNDQQKVVNEARKYLGVPYVWGGTTPAGFDCSGLVQYVYKNAVGIALPRVTTQQETTGKEVSLSSLSPGDLLFFGNRGATYHVAIYIGNNQYIHAPQPGETVKVATMSGFAPSFARRVLNDNYVPGPTVNGTVDLVNLNSLAYNIKGWMVSTADVRNTTPYLFFMDANTGKEIARQKMNRVNRPDVQKVYNTVNGSAVGWEANGNTSEQLLNKKYKLMVRYATDATGNKSATEKYFDTIYTAPTKKNDGALDSISGSGTNRTISGWHSAWNAQKGSYRYLFVMENGKEVSRVKITNSVKRPDVQKHMGSEILGSLDSGFTVSIDITKLKGKKVQFMHRYTNDPKGNNPIVDYTFAGTYTL